MAKRDLKDRLKNAVVFETNNDLKRTHGYRELRGVKYP